MKIILPYGAISPTTAPPKTDDVRQTAGLKIQVVTRTECE